MIKNIKIGNISVYETLYKFINEEALPGSGVAEAEFWAGLESVITAFAPQNEAVLAKRDSLQEQIDSWHRDHKGGAPDLEAYKAFLSEIGYLVPEGEEFVVSTENVDPEISTIAGPQLVVPLTNAR